MSLIYNQKNNVNVLQATAKKYDTIIFCLKS